MPETFPQLDADMQATIQQLRNELQAAAAKILPEAAGVRVIFASELPATLKKNGAMGWVGSDLDIVVRSHIPDWHGDRGVVIVVNDELLLDWVKKECEFLSTTSFRPILRHQMGSTVSHELGHIITDGWIPTLDETPLQTPDVIISSHKKWCSIDLPDVQSGKPMLWHGHDGRFIRATLHVAFRLQRVLGWRVSPDCESHRYGSSRAWQYGIVLDDEPKRLAHLPLADISTMPPPLAFADLWRDDMRRLYAAIDAPTYYQTSDFVNGVRLFPFPSKERRMNELLKMIGVTFQQQRCREAGNYRELVHRIAAGDEVDPGQATEILDGANKSPRDLTADVELHQKRRELRATLDALPALDSEAKKLKKQIEEANRIQEEAVKKYDSTVHPLAWRLEQIAEAKQAADRARDELLQTCSPELKSKVRDIQNELDNVRPKSTACQLSLRSVQETTRKLLCAQQRLEKSDSPWERKAKERQAAELAKQIGDGQVRAAELELEVLRLEKQKVDLLARGDEIDRERELA